MQFLMGLDESYLAIRNNLLTREPLPNVKNIFFSFISGEESHRNVTSVEWDMCNSVVVTWILNSLSSDLFASAIYAKTASEMWDVTNVTSVGTTKPAATAFVAKTFDNKKRYFELVGYPAGYVKRNFNSNSRLVTSNNASADVHSNGVSSNNATTGNSPVSLSSDQLARLMNLLNENGVSTANANMA
ncbi:hypothetical protein Tco_0137159, partial [Tanacetum coccineum]